MRWSIRNSQVQDVDLVGFAGLVSEQLRKSAEILGPKSLTDAYGGSSHADLVAANTEAGPQLQFLQSMSALKKLFEKKSGPEDHNEFVLRQDKSYSLEELLLYDDRSFVSVAYRAVLGRLPDADGQASYLAHLRNGMPKYQILEHLISSDEGKRFGTRIRGLSDITSRNRWYSLPVIGPFLRFCWPINSLDEFERKISIVQGRGTEAREEFLEDRQYLIEALLGALTQQKLLHEQLQMKFNALIVCVEDLEAQNILNRKEVSSARAPEHEFDIRRTARPGPNFEVCLTSHLLRSRAESGPHA